jgi:hypothetical protein
MAEQNAISGLARASHNGRIQAGEKAAAPQNNAASNNDRQNGGKEKRMSYTIEQETVANTNNNLLQLLLLLILPQLERLQLRLLNHIEPVTRVRVGRQPAQGASTQ